MKGTIGVSQQSMLVPLLYDHPFERSFPSTKYKYIIRNRHPVSTGLLAPGSPLSHIVSRTTLFRKKSRPPTVGCHWLRSATNFQNLTRSLKNICSCLINVKDVFLHWVPLITNNYIHRNRLVLPIKNQTF